MNLRQKYKRAKRENQLLKSMNDPKKVVFQSSNIPVVTIYDHIYVVEVSFKNSEYVEFLKKQLANHITSEIAEKYVIIEAIKSFDDRAVVLKGHVKVVDERSKYEKI